MVRQAPGARIEIDARVELHVLGGPVDLGHGVAAVDRPVPAARAVLVLQHLDLVAGVAQLHGRHHPRPARTEDLHRSPRRRLAQLHRPLEGVRRLLGVAERVHGHVHGAGAAHDPDHAEQLAPAGARPSASSVIASLPIAAEVSGHERDVATRCRPGRDAPLENLHRRKAGGAEALHGWAFRGYGLTRPEESKSMTTDDVLAEFRAAGALREGHFVLSSGAAQPGVPAEEPGVCGAAALRAAVQGAWRT